MLGSSLGDYGDAYILVKGNNNKTAASVADADNVNKKSNI